MLVPHPISGSKKKKKRKSTIYPLCNPVNSFAGKLIEPRWPFIDREIRSEL